MLLFDLVQVLMETDVIIVIPDLKYHGKEVLHVVLWWLVKKLACVMHCSGGHFEIAQRKKIACLSADSEIARSCQLVTKISDFCNEVNDYLIGPPYYNRKTDI